MKFQKSIGAIIADSRRYFLQRCKIAKKNKIQIFLLKIFFEKQKSYIFKFLFYKLDRKE